MGATHGLMKPLPRVAGEMAVPVLGLRLTAGSRGRRISGDLIPVLTDAPPRIGG